MRLIDADAVFELFKPFKDALDDEKVKSAYIQTLTLIHNAPSKERTVSDYIKREDAINAILGSLNNEAYKSSWESGAVKEVEQTLKRLPSVPTIEPTEEFEWCTDCKEYDQEKHCCHRWSKQIRKTVAELEENYKPKRGKWIYQFRDSENEEYRCSKCGFLQGDKPNFCPNCGADMREREGE